MVPRALPLAAVLLLALPVAAQAGTGSVDTYIVGRSDEHQLARVHYTAAPGETNDVLLSLRTNPDGTQSAALHDTAGVTAGAGCVATDAQTLTCKVGDPTGNADGPYTPSPHVFTLALGDGNDTAAQAPGSLPLAYDADGGAGNDVLKAGTGGGVDDSDQNSSNFPLGEQLIPTGSTFTGGPGDDTLTGGPKNDLFDEADATANGSDTIHGGGGIDRVSYLRLAPSPPLAFIGRTAPVTVDLRGRRDSGQSGERDLIGTDVEVGVGGLGNDHLYGNGGRNELQGGPGRDVMDGGSGADTLVGYAFFYDIDEDPLNDTTGERAGNVFDGGPGNDYIIGNGGNDTIRPGSGSDSVKAGAGNDRIWVRDLSYDEVRCGTGRDFVDAGALDYAEHCARIHRTGLLRALPAGIRFRDYTLPRINRPEGGVRAGAVVPVWCPGGLHRCTVDVTVTSGGTIAHRRLVLRPGVSQVNTPLTARGRSLLSHRHYGQYVAARVTLRTLLRHRRARSMWASASFYVGN